VRNCFIGQNTYLKIAFIALNIIICLNGGIHTLGIFFALNTLLFSLSPQITRLFLKATLKLSLFWIFYLLTSILINTPFPQQMTFLVKVLFLLQISVFARVSSQLPYFLFDTKAFHKYAIFTNICYFFLYTDYLIKYLYQGFKNIDYSTGLSGVNIEQIILKVKAVLHNAVDVKDNLPIIDLEEIKKIQRPFLCLPNTLLLVVILIYALLWYI